MGFDLHQPEPEPPPSDVFDVGQAVATGAAIRKEIVDPLVDGTVLDETTRLAAEVLCCSFFLPMLADEEKIAVALGAPKGKILAMGRRLRAAGIWHGNRLAEDAYKMLMDEDPMAANVNIALLCAVAKCHFYAARRADGEFVFSLERPLAQTYYDAPSCAKCGTTKRYTNCGACVECQRRYMRQYFNRKDAVP